jgi:hypothetical protein
VECARSSGGQCRFISVYIWFSVVYAIGPATKMWLPISKSYREGSSMMVALVNLCRMMQLLFWLFNTSGGGHMLIDDSARSVISAWYPSGRSC